VTTDDLCDALAELTSQLLDEQLAGSSVGERLSAIRPAFGARGGYRTGAEPGPRLRGAGMRNGRPSNVRERLEAWPGAEAARRPVPTGWTRGLSRGGRRWF